MSVTMIASPPNARDTTLRRGEARAALPREGGREGSPLKTDPPQ